MARPHICRCVAGTPRATLFKPAGVPACHLEAVELRLDELEALRLADLEGDYQEVAAEKMGISRATFARLVESARRKVADVLLHGKVLVIQGGSVMVANQRSFECTACRHRFQAACGTGRPAECPACHGHNFHRAEESGSRGRGQCRRRGQQGAGAGRGNCRRMRGGRATADQPSTAAGTDKKGDQAR